MKKIKWAELPSRSKYTPDADLAQEVRSLGALMNLAIKRAHDAGLHVEIQVHEDGCISGAIQRRIEL